MTPSELLKFVKLGSEKLPIINYAIGCLSIMSIIALANTFNLTVNLVVGGSLAIIATMVVLFLLEKAQRSNMNKYKHQINLMVWTITICFSLGLILTLSSYVFHWPINFQSNENKSLANSNQVDSTHKNFQEERSLKVTETNAKPTLNQTSIGYVKYYFEGGINANQVK